MITRIFRHDLVLTQRFVDRLGLDGQGAPVLFVATNVTLAGGAISGHPVTIIAERLDSVTTDVARSLVVRRSEGGASGGAAPVAGHPVEIVCRHFVRGGATSVGQQGVKGAKGATGADMECGPGDPEDGPVIKPPKGNGEQGFAGQQGGKGGPGGAVVVRVVSADSAGVFAGQGGPGGTGGDGGDGGQGCPPSPGRQGPQGVKGPAGVRGDDVAAIVTSITDAQFQARADEFALEWARVRVETAKHSLRLRDVSEAVGELNAAERMEPTAAGAFALRRLIGDDLTPVGTPRTMESLTTDVDPAALADDARARLLDDLLPPDGSGTLTNGLDHATLIAGARRIAAAIQRERQSVIPTALSQAGRRHAAFVDGRPLAEGLIRECVDRIALLDPDRLVTDATGLGARDVADAIQSILQLDGGRRLLLAAPDLLAPIVVADAHVGLLEDDPALGSLAASGGGLAAMAHWATTTVRFSRLRGDLRSSSFPAAMRQELMELAELAHRWRLADGRIAQHDAVVASVGALDSHASAVAFGLNETNTPVTLPAHRVAAQVVEGMRVLRDLSTLVTGEEDEVRRTYTNRQDEPPSLESAASEFVYQHDVVADFVDGTHEVDGVDLLVPLWTRNTNPAAYTAYKQSGRFVEGRGNSGVEPLRFTSIDRPDLIDRLKTAKNFWIDASLDDLTTARRDAKVAGVGLWLFGVVHEDGGAELPVEIEHSGISTQRLRSSDSTPVQVVAPAVVSLTLKQPFADQPDVWFAAMRFDDAGEPNPDDSDTVVGQPYQFPLWARGAAAGWRVRLLQPGATDLSNLTGFDFEIEYDAFVTGASPSLLRIDHPIGAMAEGSAASATVVLTAPAPVGGAQVTLQSSDATRIRVPGQIVVPAGASSASFAVEVVSAGGDGVVQLTAQSTDGFARRTLLAVSKATGDAPGESSLDLRAVDEPLGSIHSVAVVPGTDTVLATFGPISPTDPLTALPRGGLVVTNTAFAAPQRIEIGFEPRSVAVDASDGRAFVSRGAVNGSTLSVIDLATRTLVGEPVPIGPLLDLALDAAGRRLYGANPTAESVDIINTGTMAVAARVENLTGAHAVAFDADAGRLYVAVTRRAQNQLERINALAVIERGRNDSFAVTRRIDFPDAAETLDVAFDAETGVIFVADAGSPAAKPGLFVIDRDSLQVVDKMLMPGPIARVHTHAPSGTVITTGPTDVLLADAKRMEFVTRRSIGTFPLGLAFEPSGAWIVGDARSGVLHRVASIPLAATPWR